MLEVRKLYPYSRIKLVPRNFYSIDEPFLSAVKEGDVDKVEEYIVNGANINAVEYCYKKNSPSISSGRSVLQCAIEADNIKMVKLLLKHNVDVNFRPPNLAYPEPPILIAAQHGKIEIFMLLWANGADINSKFKKFNLKNLYSNEILCYTTAKETLIHFYKERFSVCNNCVPLSLNDKRIEPTKILQEIEKCKVIYQDKLDMITILDEIKNVINQSLLRKSFDFKAVYNTKRFSDIIFV